MAGFGGQGILLIGNLLAYAAIREGRNTSYFPAYGVEKRGGAATCTVVVADGEVGSPVIGNPGAAILLNPLSMEKYFGRVRAGGLCIVNSSLIEESGDGRSDLRVLRLPLNELALEIGDARRTDRRRLPRCPQGSPDRRLAGAQPSLHPPQRAGHRSGCRPCPRGDRRGRLMIQFPSFRLSP